MQVVFYFVTVELGTRLKLNLLLKKFFQKAKRFYEIPDFKQYAIADCIFRILFASRMGIVISQSKTDTAQYSFNFD